MTIVVLLQIFSTFFLGGLSWFVQWVHYPLFHQVGEADFKQFHKKHVALTNGIICALLPMEIVTTSLTAYYGYPGLTQTEWWLGSLMLILIVLSTFLVQIPLHKKLSEGKSKTAINSLVLSHTFRTMLWSLRALLLGKLMLNRLS
ncbi:MAG: hypothetical protein FJ112_06430 [Deltaproteobacteria bacterium]|nr:hypothetical protein [Deltaproteobacteria bacterium]